MEELNAITMVEGVVVEGDHRGRELGFPTANVIAGPDESLPEDAVYAGHVTRANGTVFAAGISIGTRPTFYESGGIRLVEAHLIDFDGDLYGERIQIVVEMRLRGQLRFRSKEDLIVQIREDVNKVRALRAEETGI